MNRKKVDIAIYKYETDKKLNNRKPASLSIEGTSVSDGCEVVGSASAGASEEKEHMLVIMDR